MRILVADHDPTMLQGAARALSADFTVDVATSKLSCLAMLDVSEFHVIVACERLDDGSGLELLSQAGKRWPDVLRILAIEADRLPLLGSRLKPFKLFDTVAYPIDAEQLHSVLMLAAAAEEPHVGLRVQHIVLEDEAGAAAQEPVAAAAARGAPRTAPQAAAPARRPTRAAAPSSARAAPAPSAPARAVAPSAPAQRRAVTPSARSNTAPAVPAVNRRVDERRRVSGERRGTISVSTEELNPFPGGESLAAASQIAAALRPKLERAPNLFGSRRTTMFIAAGVTLAVMAAAAAMIYSGGNSPVALAPPARTPAPATPATSDAPPVESAMSLQPAASSPAAGADGSAEPVLAPSTQDAPEVAAFVSDIEAALVADNFVRAHYLLDALRELAPDHRRLALFEALIARGEEMQALAEDPEVQDQPAPRPTAATRASAAQREVSAARQASLKALTSPTRPAATASNATAPARPESPPPPTTAAKEAQSPLQAALRSLAPPPPSGSAQPATPAVVLPLVKEAKVIRQVEPDYPRDARREGIEGSIELRFTVTAAGKVEDIEVMRADPPQTFDRAAVAALRRWRYEPRREDGVAVDSRTRVRLEFKLADRDRR